MESDIEVVANVCTGDDAAPAALRYRPDVAVLDSQIPRIDAAARLLGRLPGCRHLILTRVGDAHEKTATGDIVTIRRPRPDPIPSGVGRGKPSWFTARAPRFRRVPPVRWAPADPGAVHSPRSRGSTLSTSRRPTSGKSCRTVVIGGRNDVASSRSTALSSAGTGQSTGPARLTCGSQGVGGGATLARSTRVGVMTRRVEPVRSPQMRDNNTSNASVATVSKSGRTVVNGGMK